MCVASLVGCGVGVLVAGNGVAVAVVVGGGVVVVGVGVGVFSVAVVFAAAAAAAAAFAAAAVDAPKSTMCVAGGMLVASHTSRTAIVSPSPARPISPSRWSRSSPSGAGTELSRPRRA